MLFGCRAFSHAAKELHDERKPKLRAAQGGGRCVAVPEGSACKTFQGVAKPYEQELKELEEELAALEAAAACTSEVASIMAGFTCSDAAGLAYIADKAETWQFSPVLVLDCTMEQADIKQLLSAVDDTWEIMLYAPAFSEETNEAVLSALSCLKADGRQHMGVFLLRDDYSNESNVQLPDGKRVYCSKRCAEQARRQQNAARVQRHRDRRKQQ